MRTNEELSVNAMRTNEEQSVNAMRTNTKPNSIRTHFFPTKIMGRKLRT